MAISTNRISFDYDGTLDSNAPMRELLGLYRRAGKQVYILTSRPPEVYRNQDLFALAQELLVPREQVLYAWGRSKVDLLREHEIGLHFDNDPHVVHEINQALHPQIGVLIHYQYVSEDIF